MKKRILLLALSFMTAAFCLSPLQQSIRASATDDGFQPLTASTLNEARLFDGSYSWVYPLANYSENEEFAIVPAFAGGMCLDYSLSNGKVQIFKLHRNYNQRWKLQKAGNYFRIVNPESGKVIAPQGSKVQSKAKAEAASLNTGLDCQLWKLDAAGDGSYFIRNKVNENLVLDITGNKTDSSTPAMLFPFSGERNQRFYFEPLTAAEPMEDWGSRRRDCNGTDWDYWDGSVDTSWYYANQNDKTYFIGSGSELAGLALLARNGKMDFAGRNIVLTKDINLCGIEWPCIGSGTNPFRGSFLGNNHAIIGLIISSTNDDHGLFGCVRGSVIRDLAVKGSVAGDWGTGGICGSLDNGIIYNVYSEVSVTRGTDDHLGGICGFVGTGGRIEHCTQNARVNSGDQDPYRGGIAGRCVNGAIRYCVNLSSVDCNWDYSGGIAGINDGGTIEYCANYGRVSGGSDTERAGGIAGASINKGIVFGCYNEGEINSSGDDYVGGIVGYGSSSRVYCCINNAHVQGRTNVGGIMGDDKCLYCLNLGTVKGSKTYGSVTGETGGRLTGCRALHWTWKCCNGKGGSNGSDWVTGEEVISGKACFDLNGGTGGITGLDYYWDGGASLGTVFYQNIGGDLIPTFSGAKVQQKNGTYINTDFCVRVSYTKDYGTVTGSGTYRSGKVTLKAEPAVGCLFDHFELTKPTVKNRTTFSGSKTHSYPVTETQIFREPELTLTENIARSYTIQAVFTVYDEVPEDLRQRVRIELESIDECSGWNSETIPVYLLDSFGEQHLWEVNRQTLDDPADKASYTFDLGGASPVSVSVYPDFGGLVSFHDHTMLVRMWVNDAGKAIESNKITIKSYPFISSVWGGDYLHFAFDNLGNASVGIRREDGSLEIKGTYTKPYDAWDAAQNLGENAVLQLQSAWICDRVLDTGSTFTLDLNGFPIIRSIKRSVSDGELICVRENTTLNITDSAPTRSTCSAFRGGSIQGGRSTNTGGLIQVESGGTLNMTGGTLYNGGTFGAGGGAIRNSAGNVSLKNVQIASCWANTHDGGGVLTKDGSFSAQGCTIRACSADAYGGGLMVKTRPAVLTDTSIIACKSAGGGAAYIRGGELQMQGGTVRSCSAGSGGAIRNAGSGQSLIRCDSVLFERNSADSNGGAVLTVSEKDSSRQNYCWLIGCTFRTNSAGNKGGAVCVDSFDADWAWETDRANSLYMQDCTVTNNASSSSGGGIYAYENTRVELCGKTIVRENDGSRSDNNLVLTASAFLYDSGLTGGSDIWLSRDDGGKTLTNGDYLFSSEHLKYLTCENGTLELTNQEEVDTALHASVFSKGYAAIIAFAVLAAVILLLTFVVRRKKKKGESE